MRVIKSLHFINTKLVDNTRSRNCWSSLVSVIFQCIITIWASSIDGLRPWSKRRFSTFCATWKQELLLVQLEQNRTRISKCQGGLPVGCIEFVASLVRIWKHTQLIFPTSYLPKGAGILVLWNSKKFPFQCGGYHGKPRLGGGPASHFSPHASYQCRNVAFSHSCVMLCIVFH